MGKGLSIFGLAFMVFVVWVVIAASNDARIERTCRPVLWLGNISVSMASLVNSNKEEYVQHIFNKMNYGCRYTIWRLLFEKEYLKAVKAGKVEGVSPEQVEQAEQGGKKQ